MENSPKMMLFRSFITVLKRKNLGRMRTSAFIKTTSSRSLTLWFYVAKHVVVTPKCQTFSIHYEYSVYDSRNQWNISDFGLSDAKYSAIRPFLFYGCWMRLNGIFEHVFFWRSTKDAIFHQVAIFFPLLVSEEISYIFETFPTNDIIKNFVECARLLAHLWI